MTEKQYKKADKMVFSTLLVVMLGIFLNMLGMLSMGKASGAILLVTIVSIVSVAATIGIYMKLAGKRNCGVFMSSAAVISWIVMVIFVDAQYFYMLAAAIFIAHMAYLEKSRIIAGAVVIVPVFAVKSMMLSQKGAVSPTEAGTSIVLMILIIVSAYNITKIWIAFNSENMETVRRVSEELVTHFDGANRYIQTLDEALNMSSLSMQDIATNIESTAHEIQNQSQKCQDIGDNTKNAKEQTDVMVLASGKALEVVSAYCSFITHESKPQTISLI